ncbi:hypothetical protein AAVH_13710 [Aphelenchoides avenae]|nr:hypothetical protein AAVH_13710 [Aphelenchus avenae]
MATLMTLGIAGRTPDDNDLFQQLLAAVKKVPHAQVIIAPPPPIQNDAYVHQAKQLMETFPERCGMTDTGGSLLQACPAIATMKVHSRFQIGRYGTHADRRYVSGDKWDKDGILALKAHLVQVVGHHWLRNTPKASAAFPLRQLHQLQLDSSGKANTSASFVFPEMEITFSVAARVPAIYFSPLRMYAIRLFGAPHSLSRSTCGTWFHLQCTDMPTLPSGRQDWKCDACTTPPPAPQSAPPAPVTQPVRSRILKRGATTANHIRDAELPATKQL